MSESLFDFVSSIVIYFMFANRILLKTKLNSTVGHLYSFRGGGGGGGG